MEIFMAASIHFIGTKANEILALKSYIITYYVANGSWIDLQLDIDMHMKETADLILQKEQGIAEMVGDYAKLQAQFRNEVEQKVGRSFTSPCKDIYGYICIMYIYDIDINQMISICTIYTCMSSMNGRYYIDMAYSI